MKQNNTGWEKEFDEKFMGVEAHDRSESTGEWFRYDATESVKSFISKILTKEKQNSWNEGVEEMASRILISYNFIPDGEIKNTLIESLKRQLNILSPTGVQRHSGEEEKL